MEGQVHSAKAPGSVAEDQCAGQGVRRLAGCA